MGHGSTIRIAALSCAAVAALALSPTTARGADPYKDKTIKLIVGSAEGSGVDILSRAVSRHLGKHIPGGPRLIVLNMPLPQSVAAANHVYNVAKPDGLTIGSGSAGLFSRAISQPNIRFDLNKITWLANLYSATVLFWMRSDFACPTLDALKTCPQRLKFGATSRGSTGYGLVPELLKESLGLKLDMIYGYKSSAILLALEQGEVQASGGDLIGFFGGRQAAMQKEGKLKILLQVAGKKSPELVSYNVPWVMDVVPDSHKGLFAMVNPIIDMARPFFAPPNLPAGPTATLRAGFAGLARDKDFQAEVKKVARIDVDYLPGDQMAGAIKAMLDQPKAVKDRVIGLLQKGKKKKKKN
jgi:tripartite-type tricarboxylate transporter receptor subunit TctC